MADRCFVDVDRGPIEYVWRAGRTDMPSLVFLHEGLGSIELWRGFDDDVRRATGGAPALTFARHGYGGSAPAAMPRGVGYMHHEADVVLPALLAALEVERPVLIGHSDGASIALLYAGAGHPVAGLVCIAPHVFVEDESIAGIASARDAFVGTDMASRLARYHADPVATFRGWNDIWLSPEFRNWNIEERLPGVAAPTLLVQGTSDRYGTLAQLDAIERGVAGPVARRVVDGAGHAPHLDDRDAVVRAVATFVVGLHD